MSATRGSLAVGLVALVLLAATPGVAEEPIALARTSKVPVAPPSAGASHGLELSLHVFRDGRWTQEQAAAAALASARLLAQCGVALVDAEVRVVQAPRRFRVYQTRVSRELLRRIAARKPAVFFVDDTRNDPAFDAEAIGRANAATRPELADTVWIAHGARDLPQALAHELVHLLADSGEHSDEPGNLMQPETLRGNTRLDRGQCERLRARGESNGLLRRLRP